MVYSKVLTKETINPNVITLQYAVRGPIVLRSIEIEREISNGIPKPFDNLIKTNNGDAQANGQIPLTFVRQVLACLVDTSLMDKAGYPSDVVEKAKLILDHCSGKTIGAYSHSNGIEMIRKHAAEFIQNRDGVPCDFENVILSAGASDSIRNVMELFIRYSNYDKKIGVMTPIPQYPEYSATIVEFNHAQVPYYLDEDNNWSLDIDELERAYEESLEKYDTKILVVINPGNPTGQVLTRQNIESIVKFAHRHNLFLLADEVYQENIYHPESKFYSFKRVLCEMGEPYSTSQELISFNSVSKGFMCECGFRAGFVEFHNLDPEVVLLYKKLISAKSCSSIIGQAVTEIYVNPPKPGSPSYDLWKKEKDHILSSLGERAVMVQQAYNTIDGMKCNSVQGAMYAFPRIYLPRKAIEEAKSLNQEPDFFYAMQLVEKTGIIAIPGSGFGQKPGTHHVRITILPQIPQMKDMLSRLRKFHEEFLEEYKD